LPHLCVPGYGPCDSKFVFSRTAKLAGQRECDESRIESGTRSGQAFLNPDFVLFVTFVVVPSTIRTSEGNPDAPRRSRRTRRKSQKRLCRLEMHSIESLRIPRPGIPELQLGIFVRVVLPRMRRTSRNQSRAGARGCQGRNDPAHFAVLVFFKDSKAGWMTHECHGKVEAASCRLRIPHRCDRRRSPGHCFLHFSRLAKSGGTPLRQARIRQSSLPSLSFLDSTRGCP